MSKQNVLEKTFLKRSIVRLPFVVGALLGVVLWTAPVAAQQTATATLYENLEAPGGEIQTNGARTMPGVIRVTPDGFERLAQATETGTITSGATIFGLASDTGTIVAHGQSRIPIV